MWSIAVLAVLVGLVLGQPQPIATDNCLVLNSAGTCSVCQEGFYLEYFLCLPCAPLCRCSSQHNYCQSCTNTTYPNTNYLQLSVYSPEHMKCIYCYAHIPYCLQCANLSHCSQCFGGRYPLQTAHGVNCSDLLCQPNCQVCRNTTACQLCQEGYFLEGHACSSLPCQPNCLTCSTTSACSKCLPGFRAEAGQCVNCSANCLECNGLECLQCQPGYYYSSGSGCVSTGYSNCVVYVGGAAAATDCMACEPGYYVYFGNCIQCVGCEECALQFLCETPCFQNATPFNYACLEPFTFDGPWLFIPAVLTLLLFLS